MTNDTAIQTLFTQPPAANVPGLTVSGWVRTVRDSKAFGFIELNDGTHFKNLQVVLEDFNPRDLQPIHAVYVGKPGQLPMRTRAVLDFLKEHVDLRFAEALPPQFIAP